MNGPASRTRCPPPSAAGAPGLLLTRPARRRFLRTMQPLSQELVGKSEEQLIRELLDSFQDDAHLIEPADWLRPAVNVSTTRAAPCRSLVAWHARLCARRWLPRPIPDGRAGGRAGGRRHYCRRRRWWTRRRWQQPVWFTSAALTLASWPCLSALPPAPCCLATCPWFGPCTLPAVILQPPSPPRQARWCCTRRRTRSPGRAPRGCEWHCPA